MATRTRADLAKAAHSGGLSVAVVAACPLPCPRGTPTRILRLSEALARNGHDVHVVTYHFGTEYYEPPYPNLSVHRIANVPTYRRLEPGPSLQKLLVLDVMLFRRLRKLLSNTVIDVIHAHHYEGLLVGARARRHTSIPLIYDAHTLLEMELPHYSIGLPKAMKLALGRKLDRKLPPLADGILSVSSEIERKLSPLMPTPEHLRTVPNGVELDMFSGARRRTGDGSGNPVRRQTVVYTGTLAPYQGIETMLEIFSRVANENSNVVLKIVSESSFKPYEHLTRELRIRERIELVRAKFAELSGLLAGADVAVNPRTSCPGLPQKNLNYMAAALPIVCFSSSAKQLIANETALVVDDGDVDGFSRAIRYLLDNPDPAAALGTRGRRYVEEHRSWEASARLTEQFYGHLIDASQRHSS